MTTRAHLFLTAVTAVAVIVTVGVVMLVSDPGGDKSGRSLELVRRASNDPPRIRNQLAVCVQTIDVDPAFGNVAKEAVESALDDIAKADPAWSRGFIFGALVHIGCPHQPALNEDYLGRLVQAPSFYHTFVFVLTADQITDYLGLDRGADVIGRKSTIVVGSEERTCDGDACRSETYGIYLTPDDLANRDKYLYDMYWALYAGHLAERPGPPDPYSELVEAILPPS